MGSVQDGMPVLVASCIQMSHSACSQILTPLQCACFFHQCYPFGPDILSLMAVASAAADEPRASDIYQDVRQNTGNFVATPEWRTALVQPLLRLRARA